MEKAEMILKSNAIFTGCGDEVLQNGFVAISHGKILGLGEQKDSDVYCDENTAVYDLGNRLVMPGLQDAHLHMYMSGLYDSPYVQVSTGDESEEDCVERLWQMAPLPDKNRWLIGAGWYSPRWKNPKLPTKASLDRIYPEQPVCMVSEDCHTLWFNSAGLHKLGLNRDSVAPEGGYYGYLENGELSGTAHETAAFSLLPRVYDFHEEEEDSFYENFIKKLNSYGITSVCDMSMMPLPGMDFVREDIYERLLRAGKLSVRVNMYPTLLPDLSRPRRMREKYQGQILRCQGVKQFMDGVSSFHTAYLKEDYTNARYPGDRGRLTVPVEQMEAMVLAAAKEQIPVRVHAIGDEAIHLMIQIYNKAARCYPQVFLQHTLEHLENFQEEDIRNLALGHIIPSVQPAHVVLDMVGVEHDLGHERICLMWPFRRLLDAGCTLAFGTDSPVVEVNPFRNIYNAVTRKHADTLQPEMGWNPDERITLSEALRAYTYGSACAASRQEMTGTLEPGKFADLAILDRNPFEIEEDEIRNIKVYMTILEGRIVYVEKTGDH